MKNELPGEGQSLIEFKFHCVPKESSGFCVRRYSFGKKKRSEERTLRRRDKNTAFIEKKKQMQVKKRTFSQAAPAEVQPTEF